MKLLNKIITACMLSLLSSQTAYSYSDIPENINILVIPASNQAVIYKNNIDDYFKKLSTNKEIGNCNGGSIKIGTAYINKHPKNINNKILMSSLTDKKSKKYLTNILATYSDDNINGFGGILFYYIQGNELILHGISIADGVTTEDNPPLTDINNFQKLSQSICRTILPFPLVGE